MLPVLADFPKDRATEVLATAARTLLPNPGIAPMAALTDVDYEIVERVLAEARARLKLGKDGSAKSISRLAEFLAYELSNTLIPNDESEEIRARIGSKGFLPTSLYRMEFTPKFDAGVDFYQVSRNHIRNAVLHADMTEHLMSEIVAGDDTPFGSLFFFTPPIKKGPAYSILIKADRIGARLLIDEAYRVYHDEIRLVDAGSPLEILRRFLDKFGLDIELNGERSRLIIRKVIYATAGQVITLVHGDGSRIAHKCENDGPVEVVLAYSVSDGLYAEQLMRHGVEAKIPQASRSSTLFRAVPGSLIRGHRSGL